MYAVKNSHEAITQTKLVVLKIIQASFVHLYTYNVREKSSSFSCWWLECAHAQYRMATIHVGSKIE